MTTDKFVEPFRFPGVKSNGQAVGGDPTSVLAFFARHPNNVFLDVHVHKEDLEMDKSSRRIKPSAKWVTVPLDDIIHGKVRSHAVEQHKDWPTVVAEAMKLWLAAQHRRVA